MKTLAFDISSSITGWSVIDNGKLTDYGVIQPLKTMSITQRLYTFGNEIEKVIDRCKPDEIVIEEVIQVQGITVMRTLARFNGVAIYQCYKYQKREVTLLEPSLWKKAMGLRGSATKIEIQIKVCETFKLLSKSVLNGYKEELEAIFARYNKVKNVLTEVKKEVSLLNAKLKQKRPTDIEKKQMTEEIKVLKERIKELERREKKATIIMKKEMKQQSVDIYSDSGIDDNIADSIGVNLAFREMM